MKRCCRRRRSRRSRRSRFKVAFLIINNNNYILANVEAFFFLRLKKI